MSREVIGDAPPGAPDRPRRSPVTPKTAPVPKAAPAPKTAQAPKTGPAPSAGAATVPAPTTGAGPPKADRAPDPAARAHATPPRGDGPADGLRKGLRFRGRVPLTAALAALLLCGAVGAGYAWSGSARARGPAVVAAITSAISVGGEAQPARALLSMTVANPGPGDVRVAGYADPPPTTAIGALDLPSALVPEGQTVELTVDVTLHCDRPHPLTLPDLVLEMPSGARRQVTAVGSTAALTDLCAGGRPETRPLQLTAVRSDGGRLLVEVTSPSGRRARIDRVAAGGVTLVADVPAEVDGERRLLTLDPPAACPVAWQVGGVPATLLLEIDAGGPGAVSLRVGGPLVRWVLDTVCGAQP